jgi:hypothetical protein
MPGWAARQAASAAGSGRTGANSSDWKPPEPDQTANAGVKQLPARDRDALRIVDQAGHFGAYGKRPAGGECRVQGAQFGGLPGMIGAMQAVEFAQDGRSRRTRLRFVEAGDQDFDARAENEGFLMMERRFAAGGQPKNQRRQKS